MLVQATTSRLRILHDTRTTDAAIVNGSMLRPSEYFYNNEGSTLPTRGSEDEIGDCRLSRAVSMPAGERFYLRCGAIIRPLRRMLWRIVHEAAETTVPYNGDVPHPVA